MSWKSGAHEDPRAEDGLLQGGFFVLLGGGLLELMNFET